MAVSTSFATHLHHDSKGVVMTTATKDIQEVVNNLIEICRDGQQGFEAAANAVDSPMLKKELMHHGRERGEFVRILASALVEMGHEPVNHGTASGALHRGWIHMMNLKPGDNEHAVLAACERGEDSAVDAYTDAMEALLAGRIGELIAGQYLVVKSAHDRIRQMRDAAKDQSGSNWRHESSSHDAANQL
jgi:uncharacterized protein (TIGR02284 family)